MIFNKYGIFYAGDFHPEEIVSVRGSPIDFRFTIVIL